MCVSWLTPAAISCLDGRETLISVNGGSRQWEQQRQWLRFLRYVKRISSGTAASSSWRTLRKQLRGKNISQKQPARTPTPLGLIQVDIKSTKRIFHKICRKKKSLALIDGARETFCLCLCSISQRCFSFLLNNAQGYWSSDLSSTRSASLHRLPRARPYLLQWCMSWCSMQP